VLTQLVELADDRVRAAPPAHPTDPGPYSGSRRR
jgi:hypothetical protein